MAYLRNPAFKIKDGDYHFSTDLTGQVNHLGVTIEAGGMGLISGRKVFQKSMDEEIKLLHKIQDVYLCKDFRVLNLN